jgi:hypothetical protein
MADYLDFLGVPLAVKKIFPHVTDAAISRYLPSVLWPLQLIGLMDNVIILAALATIRTEVGGLKPVVEKQSRFNTKTVPFDRYEFNEWLGNTVPGDGKRFRGRGFAQLKGRANYMRIGEKIGVDLVRSPDAANNPDVAGKILAALLKESAEQIRSAVRNDDWESCRRLINGRTYGVDEFAQAIRAGAEIFEQQRDEPVLLKEEVDLVAVGHDIGHGIDIMIGAHGAPAENALPSQGSPVDVEKREISAWIEGGEPPLDVGVKYRLFVKIGELPQHVLASTKLMNLDWGNHEGLRILVVISGRDLSVDPPQRELWLPKEGDSAPIFFDITFNGNDLLLLRIMFYLAHELTLLQEFEIPISIRLRVPHHALPA